MMDIRLALSLQTMLRSAPDDAKDVVHDIQLHAERLQRENRLIKGREIIAIILQSFRSSDLVFTIERLIRLEHPGWLPLPAVYEARGIPFRLPACHWILRGLDWPSPLRFHDQTKQHKRPPLRPSDLTKQRSLLLLRNHVALSPPLQLVFNVAKLLRDRVPPSARRQLGCSAHLELPWLTAFSSHFKCFRVTAHRSLMMNRLK